MRQYHQIKAKHPGTLLLFRVGDFYETFADDAVTVSRELGITLTKRNNGGDMTPLAGFPFHALDTYLPKLVRKGHRVAICEQTEDPAEAKANNRKIVDREVTEIMTPGVTMSDKLLDHKRNNYLCSVHISGGTAGVAFADVSTGEMGVTQVDKAALGAFVNSIGPAELLIPKKLKNEPPVSPDGSVTTLVEDWVFDGDYAYQLLLDHFRTHSLKGFGVEDLPVACTAAGVLLHYIRENQKASLAHIRRIYSFENREFMMLDAATKRNLELTSTMQDGHTEGSLIGILDDTCTAMGGRLLRRWLHQPLKRVATIRERLNAVDALMKQNSLRQEVREELEHIGDLERLMSRIVVGRANARDLVQLQLSLSIIPILKRHITTFDDPAIKGIQSDLSALSALQDRIRQALVEEPPASLRDGGFIRDGFSKELDELRDIARNGKTYIAKVQKDLIARTGITSLKLGYNKVFGYYIEVTNVHKEKIPQDFIRKQTLVNAERYITPDLKDIEEKILSAEERMSAIESELFEQLRLEVAEFAEHVQQNAQAVARLDAFQSLAEVAFRNRYAKPEVNDSSRLIIKAGRHPVVERFMPMGEPFIPNDIELDTDDQQIMMITGPNMAGKSIILRQTGLIVLLAQIGSFVPADAAEIGLVDKIFTRVGAQDNLAAGESTFLVEMNEAANILNNATPKSLILLDEVGRGTSTFDGLSIAWSLAEYLHNQPSVAAKTLFATHYHELNELESLYPRIKNFNVQVTEHDGRVIFLRKLIRGGADHSYGIQVAAMAGLPDAVLIRAREILNNLEEHSLEIAGKKQVTRDVVKNLERQDPIPQLSLFATTVDPRYEQIKTKLEAMDPNRMTPIEALLLLTELKRLTL